MNGEDACEGGRAAAATGIDRRFDEVYERLRELARGQRRRFDGGTLDTTALVHEVYLHFRDRPDALAPRDFFAYAARAMRHLLIDRARRHARDKHGGDLRRTTLDPEHEGFADAAAGQLLELDAALARLRSEQPRAAEVVELHWFAGLEFDAIADLLGLNRRTIQRDWRYARAWLHQTMA
jgi:RNA polymerase sigma factor (TIGR02999 family)